MRYSDVNHNYTSLVGENDQMRTPIQLKKKKIASVRTPLMINIKRACLLNNHINTHRCQPSMTELACM